MLASESRQPSKPSLQFICPFERNTTGIKYTQHKGRHEYNEYEHEIDPGYYQYEKFFQYKRSNAFNISKENTVPTTPKKQSKYVARSELTDEENDAIINESISSLGFIVGRFEFQKGIENLLAGYFQDAVEHFTLSVYHNHHRGAFNLALCYEQGIGVKRDLKTAKRLYEVASQLGNAKASYNLGIFHAKGIGGTKQNFQKAKNLFKQAANSGNADGRNVLRNDHNKKIQGSENFREAFKFIPKTTKSICSDIANQNPTIYVTVP